MNLSQNTIFSFLNTQKGRKRTNTAKEVPRDHNVSDK